jgi:hypothetical protein
MTRYAARGGRLAVEVDPANPERRDDTVPADGDINAPRLYCMLVQSGIRTQIESAAFSPHTPFAADGSTSDE